MNILGIDPGKQTGLAYYVDGKLSRLSTIEPKELYKLISLEDIDLVVFEDSRLQKHIWSRSTNINVASKIARDVGMIDGICYFIELYCDSKKIKHVSISPKGKGKKVSAKEFKVITGWDTKSNQHERDAAIVAFKFRHSN